jgi:NAD(P)H-hydrate epimerase
MVVLSATQIRNWDLFTIQNEPILSIDLMERAAKQCAEWIIKHYPNASFQIYCGKGNNGGDGLAIARLLANKNNQCAVHILETGQKGTDDFQTNLSRLHSTRVSVHYIQREDHLLTIPSSTIIIDALFGTGLNREVEGLAASVIKHLNKSKATIISIDIPSGLAADTPSINFTTTLASHTLSLQCYKPAFLFAENALTIGCLHLLPIGLHASYKQLQEPFANITDLALVKSIYRPRHPFAHKGNFGHSLLVAGSNGKMGAAILAAKACARAGTGLLTVMMPEKAATILHTSLPEAMLLETNNEFVPNDFLKEQLKPFKAIGIGPGLGTTPASATLLNAIITNSKCPLVIDADGLNLLAANPLWLQQLPSTTILTPHPKEFDRLFGNHSNGFARFETAVKKAKALQLIIVLKGHYTCIALPNGNIYFNTSGNAGMAKGGSGDVLTGMLTALLAQEYNPADAAVFGVYLHGLAGDFAEEQWGQEAMLPSDLIEQIGKAFTSLTQIL